MSWILLSLAAAAFISVSYVATKKALKKEHAYELHLTALVIVLLLSSPLLIGQTFVLSSLWVLLIIKSLIVGLGQYTALRSFRHLELSEAAPLRNISSLFVLLLAVIFLGEKITGMNLFGILVLVFGTYFLERASHKTKNAYDISFLKNKFVLLALLSVFLLSVSAVLDKYLVPEMGFKQVWVLGNLFTLIIMIPIYMYQHKTFKKIIPKFKKNLSWVLVASITSTIGSGLYFLAVAQPGALISIIIPVRRLSVLFAVVISRDMFHDHNVAHKSFATFIMMIGFFLTVL